MKHLGLIAVAALASCLIAKAQRSDTAKEVIALEKRFNAAMLRADWKTIEQLYAEDIVFTNSDGSLSRRSDTLREIQSGNTKFESLEISDLKIKDFGNVAVVTGKLVEKGHYKTTDLGGTYRYTDVWAKRSGGWQLVVGQETLCTPEDSGYVAELDRLKFYLGDWDYSEIYEKSALFPNGGQNTGRWTVRVGPQGRSIIHAAVSHGTADNYETIEVMTWDAKEKVYRDHSLWYDSGDQWTYVGHFEGETLVYHAEFDQDGKHVKFRSETRPRPGGGFTIDEFASVDGGPEQKLLRGTAVPRQGQSASSKPPTTQQSEPSSVPDQADMTKRMVELSCDVFSVRI